MSTKNVDIPIECKISLSHYRANTCYVEILSLFQELLSMTTLDKVQQRDYQNRFSQQLDMIRHFSKKMEALILNKPLTLKI